MDKLSSLAAPVAADLPALKPAKSNRITPKSPNRSKTVTVSPVPATLANIVLATALDDSRVRFKHQKPGDDNISAAASSRTNITSSKGTQGGFFVDVKFFEATSVLQKALEGKGKKLTEKERTGIGGLTMTLDKNRASFDWTLYEITWTQRWPVCFYLCGTTESFGGELEFGTVRANKQDALRISLKPYGDLDVILGGGLQDIAVTRKRKGFTSESIEPGGDIFELCKNCAKLEANGGVHGEAALTVAPCQEGDPNCYEAVTSAKASLQAKLEIFCIVSFGFNGPEGSFGPWKLASARVDKNGKSALSISK